MEDVNEKADPALNPTFERKIIVVERKVYVKDNNWTSSAVSLCHLIICYLVMDHSTAQQQNDSNSC
ncbi:hypothetical protein KY285_032045 [Solanum tuberosum]|nr:hypothetical protein KY285_032045 [Solanum tuberosum]